ncbi:MAG: signal peptidase II [Nitrospinota bacterium]
MNKYFRFGIFVFFILILDQITKYWIHRELALYDSIEVVAGLFNIVYIRNSGAAFGILANSNSFWVPVFFIAVSLFAFVLLFFILRGVAESDKISIFAIASIFGGALGNFIDRISRGEVVDFLDFYWGAFHWPSFNVADSFISIGVVLFMVINVFARKKVLQK